MFSGIIEAKSKVLEFQKLGPENQETSLARIQIIKPKEFNDLKSGDSIAVNGVCLTVESQTETAVQFALGAETLKITSWDETLLRNQELNLERSLRLGDRVHGHFVTGHVDAQAEVTHLSDQAGSWILQIKIPQRLSAYVWAKGSLAINGVSLTINSIENDILSFCLIPETITRTNLSSLAVGSKVLIEVDTFARALVRNAGLK